MADLTPAHELRAHARRTISVQSCLKVYDTLLDRRGDNLTAWPSVGSLSESTGATTRTVRLALRALERTGWIVQVETERDQ